MSDDGEKAEESKERVGFKGYEDARAIVRLFQCAQCSYPIREPMTLPCGNSMCRPCIPPLHTRPNITYPLNAGRAQGFICPVKDCGLEHSLADCSLDVALNKLVGVVKAQISTYASETSDRPLLLEEKLHWPNVVDSSMDVMPRSRVLHGGRLVATYTLANMGELDYCSELSYSVVDEKVGDDDPALLEETVINDLKSIMRSELDCHVCYGLMVDPLTTPCGHTFCRKCVARVLDHSNLCPACRRPLLLRPGVVSEPTNKRILSMIESLLPDELAARIVAVQQEETFDEEDWIALFPCTLAYPLMPTFLHVFEPRYRLMIRRCLENGSRRFGMMMYNARQTPQGSLGRSTFMQYGTVLHVERLEMFPDGRSLLETQGVNRFKVLEASMLDGYNIGRIQRIDDIPLAEEEALEALETSGPEPSADDPQARINHMSTQALLQYGLDFISRARAQSAEWLHERVLAAYGQPPTDPALFPYWFASVLPIADDQKYLLLPTTSVRERLKMTARWIHRLEAARCLYEAAVAERILHLARQAEAEQHEEEEDSDSESPAPARPSENRDGSNPNNHEPQHDQPPASAPASSLEESSS